MAFQEYMQKTHLSLRRQYYSELTVLLTILLGYLLSLIGLYTFSDVNLVEPLWVPILWGSTLLAYVVFIVILLPSRFNKLQKILVLTFYNEAQKEGLSFIPNPKGGQDFSYATLFPEVGLDLPSKGYVLTRFEINKRLVHILYFKDERGRRLLIHIPHVVSPYYLQINNNGLIAPENYKDIPLNKIAFASPYNLSYFVSSGLTNAKIYLRKELEPRFVAILNHKLGLYQYITTYREEWLYLLDYEDYYPLPLGKIFEASYYEKRLNHLKTLQSMINIMLDKGR